MKTGIFSAVAGVAIVATGCVSTVSGTKTGGVPFVRDRVEARYERPAGQVFEAAKEVVKFDGTLVSETTLHGTNNVLALEGRVNQRSVWISVEQVDPKVSLVLVQARTKGGGTDQSLCHQLDKEIALKLVR